MSSSHRRDRSGTSRFGVLTVALAVCGCSANDEFAARSQAVIGGTPVAASAHTSTAALRFRTNGEWDINCSGTYLRSDLVLTAAHCVVKNAEPSTPLIPQDLSAYDFDDVEACAAQSNTNDGEDCDWQGVESIFVAPGYSGSTDHTHDWALVELDSAATDSRLRLAELPTLQRTSLPSELRIQSAQLDGSFPERIRPATGDYDNSSDIDSGFLVMTSVDGKTEGGDSGSGWFSIDPAASEWNPQLDVVAVLSAGSTSAAGNTAYASNVHFWLSTLNAYISLLDRENVVCAADRRYDTSGESARLLAPEYTVCVSTNSSDADSQLHYFDRAGDLIASVSTDLDEPVGLRAFTVGALTPDSPSSIPDWDVVLAVVDSNGTFTLRNSEGDVIAETTLDDSVAPEGESIDDFALTLDPMDLDFDGNVEYILGVGGKYTPFDDDLDKLTVLGGPLPLIGLYRGYLNTDPMPDFLAILSCTTGGQQGSRTRQLIAGNTYGTPPVASCVAGMENNGFTDAILHPPNEYLASLARDSNLFRLGFVYMAGGDVVCKEVTDDGRDLGQQGTTWNWVWNPVPSEPEARAIRPIRGLEDTVIGVEVTLEDRRTVEVNFGPQSLGFCNNISANHPKVGWPTPFVNDGKLALLGSRNLSTVSDSSLSAYITVAAGEPLEVDVFDPDFDGLNDRNTSEDTCFSLARVPAPGVDETSIVCFSGDAGTECEIEGTVAQVSEKDLLEGDDDESKDNSWVTVFSEDAVTCGAGRPTCSFRFEASLLDGGCGGDLITSSTESSFNGLKIRTNGALELGGQARTFAGMDASGAFSSGDPLAPYPNTTYDGSWDIMEFDVLGSGSGRVSLRQADADDEDSEDGAVANGANAEISYELLQLQSDGTLAACGPTPCEVDIVSGNYDGEVEDLAGEGLVPGIDEHEFDVATNETYVWRWNDVLTDNTVGIYTPTGSPLLHRSYARGSRRLATGVSVSATELADTEVVELAIPVDLGDESKGCGVSRGSSVVVNTAARANAILTGGGSTRDDLLRELLAAKINLVRSGLHDLPLETARIDSSELVVERVLAEAGRAIAGTSTSDDTAPEDLVALLQYVNADFVSYIGLPTYKVGGGDSDGDGLAAGIDNCPNVHNSDQLDRDQDGVGDACQPEPSVRCVHDLGNGRKAAVFGYRAYLKDYRYSIGRQNRFREVDDAQGQPTWLRKGNHPAEFVVEFDTPTLTWDLNGKIATADASSPACEVWPVVQPDCCSAGQVAVAGGDGVDVIARADGADYCLLGFGASDSLTSGVGDDAIVGGAGDDAIAPGAGHDTVWGGDGNDQILGQWTASLEAYGGPGHDRIVGGAGSDALYPGGGVDFVDAGPGSDMVVITSACEIAPGSVFEGGAGHDVLYAAISLDRIEALGASVSGFEEFQEFETTELPAGCWQEMFDGGALYGTAEVYLADRAWIYEGAQPGPVVAGTYIELGVQAHASSAISGGDVFLRNYAQVHGNVNARGVVTSQQGASVGGSVHQNVALPIESSPFASWQEPFSGGQQVTLQNGAVSTLSPGSYGHVNVSGTSRLTLRTGTYHFTSLKIEPDARWIVDDANGPVVVYVASEVQLRGTLQTSSSGIPRLFVATAGSQTLTLTRTFSGRLFVPFGEIVLESSGRDFYGSFVARRVTVRPDVRVHLDL